MKNKIFKFLNFIGKAFVYFFIIFFGIGLLYFLSVDYLRLQKFLIDFSTAGYLMLYGYVLIWIVLSFFIVRFIEFIVFIIKIIISKKRLKKNND